MSNRRIIYMACTAVVALAVVGSGSVSADESVPPSTTTTTMAEQFDEENGLIWSQIDEQTIEISFTD